MKHRIKILAAALLMTGLFVAPFNSSKISAAGMAPYYLTLTSSGTSANAGSKIALTAYAYALKCANLVIVLQGEACSDGSTPGQSPQSNKQLFISASDVTVEGAVPDGDKYYLSTGDDGKVQFTVMSASAGTRQVTVSSSYPAENGPQSVSLTFKSVTVAPAPKPKTAAPKPTPAPAPVPDPPKTPEAATLQIDGQDVVDKNNITVESNKPFELKGKTVANGVVKLYIFSTPREAVVTADAEGNWAYTLEGLEPGSHHVEAEVTDPATQKTSTRGTLVSFTVQEAKKVTPVSATTQSQKASKTWIMWMIGALILIAGGALWWWLNRRKQKVPDVALPPNKVAPTQAPTSQEDISTGPSDNDPSHKYDKNS
ncbi:MAG TPA: Ig-like domain-containing protein [Candidatus Saccharimonadales bacterium]